MINAATSMMLEDVRVIPLVNKILIKWKKPKYVPYHYHVSYSLVQQSSGLVYRQVATSSPKRSNTFSISDIIPGTQTKWVVKAIYNTATLDSGISGTTQFERSDEGE